MGEGLNSNKTNALTLKSIQTYGVTVYGKV